MNAGNATDTALGETWAFSKNYVDTCKSNPNATSIGDKIGTTYVARDLLSVVDALGEDGLLRYWGTSYGTTLGATAAAMFPERIDRLLIDSVMNIHDYWHYHDIENQKDTDKTFTAFLEACFKAGKKCALAQSDKTASSFEGEFYSWLEELKYHPISYPGFLLTYTAVKGYVVSTIYTPARYSSLAEDIKALMKGDLESLSVRGLSQLVPGVLSWSTESRLGILCGDKTSRQSRMEDSLPAVNEWMATSRLAGDGYSSSVMNCDRWHMAAKERYLGDYNVQTRHPILAMGNTYDPATSWASALNASQSFPGAVALQQNGFGHGIISQKSKCTTKAIQSYFLDGTLPEPGTVCEVDDPLF
ncbi:hypothetical protein SLS56_009488 [Neofusicoccum ribis]|uniref:Peptidase S33 tripeptidyl aminopeptidase-like C-terminal domain-containing protein n=1 Tax=Neofusicoccum ribis TaxID=45134 RepID=A0ABR3SH66_9PEZI